MLEKKQCPIIEFDEDRDAVIDPSKLFSKQDVPRYCVISFFKDVIKDVAKKENAEVIYNVDNENGDHEIYKINHDGEDICFMYAGVGAPLITGILEEIIAIGFDKIIVCGAAGVLDSAITPERVIVPNTAIRDEGTSYHYLPPGREVYPSSNALRAICETLDRNKVDFIEGTTWTTDAFWRETKSKVKLRREEGCITVEMEASALFAVAQFRNIELAQILYAGDDVGSEDWDNRDWDKRTTAREKLFWLAIKSCLKIP